jgi:hypothetical protein
MKIITRRYQMTNLQKIFLAGILVLSVMFSNTVAMGQQRELEKRLAELERVVGREDSRAFQAFVSVVMPKLIEIDKKYDLQNKLWPGVKIEDFMMFNYEVSALKTKTPLGFWNDKMWEEIPFLTSVFCRIGEILTFPPKSEEYMKKITNIAPNIVEGSYKKIVAYLSLRSRLYILSTIEVKQKGFPSVEEIINVEALKAAEIMK